LNTFFNHIINTNIDTTMKSALLLVCCCLLLTIACKKDKHEGSSTTASNTTTSSTSSTILTPKDTIEQLVEIKTEFGTMYMWLYKGTPLHRNNFLKLASQNYFDSTTFYRCIQNFVIEGGDANTKDADTLNDGMGGPGYTIPAEINTKLFKHKRGAVGAAHDDNPAKESNGSDFYIALSRMGTRHLDNRYTVFGEIISGMEVADQIVIQPKNLQDRPYTDIRVDINLIQKSRKQLRSDFNFYAY
jgi:cyclophilin family peptidyl-prolyl cis-trans isomerase